MTRVVLLTHEREVLRLTNTGKLALDAFPDWCTRVIWSRVLPDQVLTDLLQQKRAAVLFPKRTSTNDAIDTGVGLSVDEGVSLSEDIYLEHPPETLIIIDATWQEARKMLRQSTYLKLADKFSLPGHDHSNFQLRRNQIEGGLCTVECIIKICALQGRVEDVETLQSAFERFQQAKKSG